MWTFKMIDDPDGGVRTRHTPYKVTNREAIEEWMRAAVMSVRGEQPYLRQKYGLDIIPIAGGNNAEYFLRKSIEDICDLRDDVDLVSCVCDTNPSDRSIRATVTCKTIYGEITLKTMQINRLED